MFTMGKSRKLRKNLIELMLIVLLLNLTACKVDKTENKSKEEIYTCLTEEIESKLMELSEYTPELFTGEDIEESTEDEEC